MDDFKENWKERCFQQILHDKRSKFWRQKNLSKSRHFGRENIQGRHMVWSEVLVSVETMDKAKNDTNNQKHEAWNSLIEIQRVLHMERKVKSESYHLINEIDNNDKCIWTILKRYKSMREKRQTHFNNMTMMMTMSRKPIMFWCMWRSDEMKNTTSCQECGKHLIFPTIVGVECDDFLIKFFSASTFNWIKT